MAVTASVLCVLLAAFQATTGTLGDVSANTRVRGIDLLREAASGLGDDSSAGTHRGIDYTYGETASDPSRQYNGRVYDPGTGFHDLRRAPTICQAGHLLSAGIAGAERAARAQVNVGEE